MKKLIIMTWITFTTCSSLLAQSDDPTVETQNVRYVLTQYLEGWEVGDTTKVGNTMHPSCQLKSFMNGKFNHVQRNRYLQFFKPQPRQPDTKTEILDVDVTRNIASAKTRITTTKNIFTDYMHLIKTDAGWFIVDKVAVREDK